MNHGSDPKVAVVIIGRNEGDRFLSCLNSLPDHLDPVIYVDSGSTDGSIQAARAAGAQVVSLDTSAPFTAARARNAGLALLPAGRVDYVQLIDGDCALREGWIERGVKALQEHPDLAVVCGRRRERYPDASIYNGLCDAEWNTPIGPAKACGGDALMRLEAVRAVDGFRDDLIAGEEPELCLRLRQAGWGIERLDVEMTWHDAAITRFGQWWQRNRRAGHAFAEGAALHGAGTERHWVRETRRALVWGAGFPFAILVALMTAPYLGVLGLLIYPSQVIRLAARNGLGSKRAWQHAVFTTLSKFPEAQGALSYYLTARRGSRTSLIEYK